MIIILNTLEKLKDAEAVNGCNTMCWAVAYWWPSVGVSLCLHDVTYIYRLTVREGRKQTVKMRSMVYCRLHFAKSAL